MYGSRSRSRSAARWWAGTLALWLCAGGLLAQRHEHKRAERAEIYQLEETWRQAQLAENVLEMDHLLADDFLGITAAGQVLTKAQQLERMRSRQLDLTRLDMSDTKIKISGKLAVVTSLARLDGTAEGRPLTGFFRCTQVYQRAPGDGWKITNFEATRVPTTVSLNGVSLVAPGAGSRAPHATGPN